MFSSSLQETLARYTDPSQNPYVQVRSQTPEPTLDSSQHLAQTLSYPGLDVSLAIPSTNQRQPRWKLDIEAFEQPSQVLDCRGRYVQSSTLRVHSQSCVQQILPEHERIALSDCGTRLRPCVQQNLGAVPAPMHDAAVVNHKQSVPDVPQILSSQSMFPQGSVPNSGATDETMSVPAPASLNVQPSASGSRVHPIVIADESHASFMSEIFRPEMRDTITKKDQRITDKGEANSRREAWNREAEKLEIERMQIKTMESATKETKRTEIERMETENPEIERQESVAKDQAVTKKEPRVFLATNTTLKLLRIERKLNNKDLFMGWYKSRSSSELRYPRECIAPKVGDIYVHSCKKEGIPKFQLWVRQISRGMTIWVKAHIFHIHPKLLDRRLTLATTGEPYWSTRQSLSASGSRERASKIAEMILY
ncbi:hypothetical protein BDR07DRAFT_1606713 [Suillus spraguei]|nr:hypothetical protein BDR07DRAFT_1606713 [Suillus spraguei]